MPLSPLSEEQQRLLDFLLTSSDFDGKDQLLEQAETVQTAGSSCDCGCPSFFLNPNRSTPAATIPENPAIDAHGSDPGGNLVGVMLMVRDGYLHDVEVFGYESSEFAGLPDPAALRISAWSEPDENGGRRLLNE